MPQHLEEAAKGGDIDGAQGLSPDMVYGEGNEPDLGEEGGETEPPPDGADAEAPTEKPDEPEKSADEPAKPDDEPAKPEGSDWDKDRQAKDQEIANLRKDKATLEGQLAAAATKPPAEGEEPAEDDGEISELDEFADEEDRTKVVNELIRRDKQRAADDANRDNLRAYEEVLTEADKKYSPELRNEAVKRLAEVWASEGFGPANYPSPASTRVAVMGMYAQLAQEKAVEAAKKPPAKKPRQPAQDPGRGGSEVAVAPSGMETVDEAFASMAAEGKVGWAQEP